MTVDVRILLLYYDINMGKEYILCSVMKAKRLL